MLSRRACCCGGCTITFCVTVCGGLHLYGALVQVYSGATLLDQCTTGAGGCCTMPTLATAGTYTVKVTYGSNTLFNSSRSVVCGTNAIAAGAVGIVCCSGYYIPYALTITDAGGTGSMWYYGPDPIFGYPTWYGCVQSSATSSTVTTPGGVCTVAAPATHLINVCYKMQCVGGSPPFTLERDWGYVFYSGSPVYYSAGSSCPAGGLGVLCSAGPPGPCGTLVDSATGTGTPSGSSPFAITFAPLTPSGGNTTTDPVGGSVTITQ